MGMTGGLYQASATEIQQLIDDPESIDAFVEASTWAPPVREVRPKGILGWLMKLSPITIVENDPDAEPPPGYDSADDRPHCDLEGVWHGLHFLFTGTAWEGDQPACYLVRGGEDIGDAEELGYAVLHALRSDKVQQFAAFLHSLSREDLIRRFNPARMMDLEIDPGYWNRSSSADRDRLERLLDACDEVRTFVTTAAAAHAGIIVYLS